MANQIKEMSVSVVRLSPAEAEIHIRLVPASISAGTEARGRVVGPRCARAATVEIAYPLREHSRRLESPPQIVLRAIIPEPCLWDAESPFVYQCIVELWQDGQIGDRRSTEYGLGYARGS
jgi:beta-galactosidase/beta-glucuronidase